MLKNLLTSYREIDEINLEANVVKVMKPYDPAELLARLIEKLEKGRKFALAGGQMITDTIMVSKMTTLLVQMAIFNKYIRELIRQTTDLKTWDNYKTLFH